MSYLPWAVLALAAYAFVSPLMSVATTGSTKIPSNVAALLANSLLVVGTAAIVVYNDSDTLTYLVHPKTKFVLAAGVWPEWLARLTDVAAAGVIDPSAYLSSVFGDAP